MDATSKAVVQGGNVRGGDVQGGSMFGSPSSRWVAFSIDCSADSTAHP